MLAHHRNMHMKVGRGRLRHGAVAVEFALVAQIFFFLILGCFDVVSMMNAYSTLQWAATTAARTVMADPNKTTAQVQTVAQNAANSAGYTPQGGTAFSVSQAPCGAIQCMTITGTYTYQFILTKAFCSGSGPGCAVNLTESITAPVVPNS